MRYYVTTPIYYVNDVPHVGHAYTTIAADALTRARRLRGDEAFLLTGTDEHGQNISRIAREKGIPEQAHCDAIAARFVELWKRYDIAYDRFIRTTDEVHKRGVLRLWARLHAAKAPDGREAIYRGKYAGWYCPRCEAFKDEEELKQPGNICADHELPCEWTEEENFFFRLSAYEGWLRELIESGRLQIDPEVRRNEVLALIGQGLKDFSVSRARVKWGIPVPEQPDHVLYVWVDALSNYVTALGLADAAPEYRRFWDAPPAELQRMHLIGKEIIRFHCLYWPAILHAAGLPVPTREFVQGHITKNGRKLSKTTGNVIDPVALVDQFGPDAVRYFMLREGVYGQDWDFTDAAFFQRFNADLANDLGNLVSRVLTMVHKYCDGRVPAPRDLFDPRSHGDAVLARYEALDFSGALAEVWALVSRLNQEIVGFEPWSAAKDPARREQLQHFLYGHLEGLRQVANLVYPVMPGAARRIRSMLGLGSEAPTAADRRGGLLVPGTPVGATASLFPRLEKKENNVSDTTSPVPASASPADGKIDISEFAKVELRVALITAAEKIDGSKKLIKLQVDLGGESRQVVAGIAESYAPEALVGKKVALVANLKAAKLMGVESNGMVLAAEVDKKAVLLAFDGDVAPGTKIK